jgi:hypothetical protein
MGAKTGLLAYADGLAPDLIDEGKGRRTILHAMHSVVDWLAFAVWEDNRLIRSLSLAPDGGIIEDIGAAEARKLMKNMKRRTFTYGPDGALVEVTP